MIITHTADYAEKRRAEYPPIGDQLDTIWKALASTPNPPPMLAQIQAIKSKYPKPA